MCIKIVHSVIILISKYDIRKLITGDAVDVFPLHNAQGVLDNTKGHWKGPPKTFEGAFS